MNWNTINQNLQDAQAGLSAAELHGHLSGRLVGGHVLVGGSGQRIVSELLSLPAEEVPDLVEEVLEMMRASDRQLEASVFGFELLVPGDDADLDLRLQELAGWCNGFLEGLGHTLAASGFGDNTEVREILADFAEIGNLSSDVDDSNENEAYYAELYEYVRVAVMNLYTLFRTEALDEAAEQAERH